ncbi:MULTISPECIES: alpha/beta hydrolase [Spirulina sp. CCY15215]|uniref:esterase/lipase family protein n=1 Tax=Spirulina sp. CCY15215 TaxID=2767591 RepID=UPI00194F1160|nr:alpha/beta hydrolase [Spirulina major]
MKPLIFGIHGLANKPSKETLEAWWKMSIIEGLVKNCQVSAPTFDYQMIYWADLLYKYRLHDDENFPFDSLYNKEPYIEAKTGSLKEYKESWRDELQRKPLEIIGKSLDSFRLRFEIDVLSNPLLSNLMRDLHFYYESDRKIKNRQNQPQLMRTVVLNELKQAVREAKDRKIAVIGHSMGSIIAYDALRDLGQSDPDLKVAHLITIGAPLGLPYVKGKIIKERGYDPRVRTPSIVTESWVNYADKRDVIALDVHLADDYEANDLGVQVVDDVIANDYILPNGWPSYHKSYGYLRTPEFSKYIKSFLGL